MLHPIRRIGALNRSNLASVRQIESVVSSGLLKVNRCCWRTGYLSARGLNGQLKECYQKAILEVEIWAGERTYQAFQA